LSLPPLSAIRAEIARRKAAQELELVQRNADAIRARCGTLVGFVREAWHVLEPHTRLVWNWHLDAIGEHLTAITDGRINRLLINVPPGSSKSLLVSVLWQAWEWGPRGMRSMRFLATAFNDGPVKRDTRKCRDLILSEWYQALWPEVHLTRHGETSFANDGTGTREGVAFGSLTSQRGDRLICLPREVRILTDNGWLPIGRVVDERLPCRVAGWNGDHVEWQSIEAYERNPAGEIFEVSFDHGSLRCTGDHLIFTVGRGWVRADQAKNGETALYCAGVDGLPDLREVERAPCEQDAKVLQSGLLRNGKGETRSGGPHPSVCDLWEGDISRSGQDASAGILFSNMQGIGEHGGCEPIIYWRPNSDGLREVWGTILSYTSTGVEAGAENVLHILRGETAVRYKWARRLGAVLRSLRHWFQGAQSQVSLLLETVCGRHSCEANGRGRQRQVCQRSEFSPLPTRMVHNLQGNNPFSGWELLPALRINGLSRNACASCAPYRLREREHRSVEPNHGLQVLPRDNAREAGATSRVVETIIRSIRSLGFDDAHPTFNVRVSPCHNYFAEGLLVHNCDDPHSVEMAESDTERARTTRLFREGATNRLNDQVKSAIVVIMQRLHQDDVSGVILKLKMGYVHLCLPMEFEPETARRTEIGFIDPRTADGDLLDPERFPRSAVEALRRDQTSYGWAGQYQQRPSPRGGGMFKRAWFDGRILSEAEVPAGTRWVRHWDLAATKKITAARTAGVKIGRTPQGRFIVGHVITTQDEGNAVRVLITSTAGIDGREVEISLPQDPGQAGKVQGQDMVAMLAGFVAHAEIESGNKEIRAEPFAAQCEAGNVYLVRGPWNESYLDELSVFPTSNFKDQVDASSGAFGRLAASAGNVPAFSAEMLAQLMAAPVYRPRR
jgi:predicted phage terminase large subunit-like protein